MFWLLNNFKFWKDSDELNDINFIPPEIIFSCSPDTLINQTEEKSALCVGKQLIELASEQKHINYQLCLFQYQLLRILFLAIKYNMKSVKPFSFYDTKVN
jgi:hypothetical protein